MYSTTRKKRSFQQHDKKDKRKSVCCYFCPRKIVYKYVYMYPNTEEEYTDSDEEPEETRREFI